LMLRAAYHSDAFAGWEAFYFVPTVNAFRVGAQTKTPGNAGGCCL
jgi:hypothetical protein